jgi:hypothetical protein
VLRVEQGRRSAVGVYPPATVRYSDKASPVARNDENGSGSSELCLAERVGFEPTVPLRGRPLSRRVHSATLAPLRTVCVTIGRGFGSCDFAAELNVGEEIFQLVFFNDDQAV